MNHLPKVSDSFSLLQEGKASLYEKGDTLATRVKKLQAIKENAERSSKRKQVNDIKPVSEETNVQYSIQVTNVCTCVYV